VILSVIAILFSSSTPTPADVGNCVQSKAVALANEVKPIPDLAKMAVESCQELFDKLANARDAAAAPKEKDPSQRQANSAAWRRSTSDILVQLATTTVEKSRNSN